MRPAHMVRALAAMTSREVVKFVHQRGRLLSALVRPTLWLVVFAAGFQNVFGVSIIPPYRTYILYQDYIVPGLLGIVLLFHGMQSSLSMVYDREMGIMRLLMTAPLPRWYLLLCKLAAGTALAVIQAYIFLAISRLFDVDVPLIGWLYVLPAFIASGLMLGALGLLLSVYIRQMENFAGTMNFVIFGAVSVVEAARKRRDGGLLAGRGQSVHLLRRADPFRSIWYVQRHRRGGCHRVRAVVLPACRDRL